MNPVKSNVRAGAETGAQGGQHAKKITPYMRKLKPGEKVLMDVKFSVFPSILYYIAAAVALIVMQHAGTNRIVTALTGMMCMVVAFEAAKVVLYVQTSVALITTKRIIGISGETKFNIEVKKVKRVKSGGGLLIDGGPLNYVKLRCLRDPMKVAELMRNLSEE